VPTPLLTNASNTGRESLEFMGAHLEGCVRRARGKCDKTETDRAGLPTQPVSRFAPLEA